MILAIFGANSANNMLARKNSKKLIDAIKNYNVKYESYPKSLSEIVPEFLPRIPRAKYTFFFGKFTYNTSSKIPFLAYNEIPPFLPMYYFFYNDSWASRSDIETAKH